MRSTKPLWFRTVSRTLGAVATRIVAKTHLRDRIRAELATLGEDTVVVTDRGRAVAVLVSVGRWNGLQSALEELEDAVAILDHRSGVDVGTALETSLAAIEAEQADVSGPARQAG